MLESTPIEIGWIVMVSTHKDYPIVGFRQAFGITLCHVLVIARIRKTKTTIACPNQESVTHYVLHSHLKHQAIEIAMNITRDDNGFCGWKFIGFHILLFYTNIQNNLLNNK